MKVSYVNSSEARASLYICMLDLVTLIDVLPFRLIQLDKKEMLQRQNKFPCTYSRVHNSVDNLVFST